MRDEIIPIPGTFANTQIHARHGYTNKDDQQEKNYRILKVEQTLQKIMGLIYKTKNSPGGMGYAKAIFLNRTSEKLTGSMIDKNKYGSKNSNHIK